MTMVTTDTENYNFLFRKLSTFKRVFTDSQRLLQAASRTWGPFLESPGNFSGPELYFKIKIYKTLS